MADRVLIGKKTQNEHGVWVAKPGANVLDPVEAQGGNLSFDSSDRALASLRVIQTGTFQVQCKKTFMGKKGALEVGSDEQMRANADYTKRYPFELDTFGTHAEYYADLPKNANVALYGFGEGEVPFTGNAIHHQYVQNVYCDYGTQTIEFNPPLPDHIKTPYVSVFFAVGNSSGHFHPWYANVACENSQYDWQYANSQQCVHMDSAWFRGKWTFRERTIAPLGHDVNRNFPEELDFPEGRKYDWFYDPEVETEEEFNSTRSSIVNLRGLNVEPGLKPDTNRRTIVGEGSYSGSPLLGLAEGYPNGPMSTHGVDIGPYSATFGGILTEQDAAMHPPGVTLKVGSAGSLSEPLGVRPDNQPLQFAHAGYYGRGGSFADILSKYNEISFNVGDRDMHSPSSLWGGMLKSFAGLQGVTYFANNTHLKLDAFMTPTHTPTPFETEIVKTREAVTPESSWHANPKYDSEGNIKVNVGRDTGSQTNDFDQLVNRASANGFGTGYREKLPRMFRTKYWDGSETEYEWWPIGHANGHFTVARAKNASGSPLSGTNFDYSEVKAMMQQEADDMAAAGEISSNRVQYGSVPLLTKTPFSYDSREWGGEVEAELRTDAPFTSLGSIQYQPTLEWTGYNYGYLAAAYGDYSIIKEPGANNHHYGTPFITVVNKGTRFPNQLPDTEAKGYPPNSQYEPGDAFLKTRTFQGQPTSLDSFWNSFSNNTSQWVSSNTPYGEFYYADGGYAMDYASYYNYASNIYEAEKQTASIGGNKLVKVIPSDWNIQRQSFSKHNWNGGNPKAGVGTEGRRFGFGGAGSAEALGGEGEDVFDTYYGKYIVYDIEGGPIDE